MRKTAVLAPIVTLALGAAGYFVRRTELREVFDERTGLALSGAPLSIALIALSAAVVIAAAAFSLRVRAGFRSEEGFENAFGTESLAYPIAMCLIGLLWFGATVTSFVSASTWGELPLSALLFTALSALSAISVSFFAVIMYLNPRRREKRALSVVPTVFMCLCLILFYKENAANPVLLYICYTCLALVFSAMGFYALNGYAYDRPSPGKAVFSYFGSIYFCCVTLADHGNNSLRLIFLAIIAFDVVHSFMLIRNLRNLKYAVPRAASAQVE